MISLASQTQHRSVATLPARTFKSLARVARRNLTVKYNHHSAFKGVPRLSDLPNPIWMTGLDGYVGHFQSRNLNHILEKDQWDSVCLNDWDQAKALVGQRVIKTLSTRGHAYGLIKAVTQSPQGVVFVLSEGFLEKVLPVSWGDDFLVFQNEKSAQQEFSHFISSWMGELDPSVQSSLQSALSVFEESGFFNLSRNGIFTREHVVELLSASARAFTEHNQLITGFDAFKDLDTGLCGLIFFYHPELEHNDPVMELVRRLGVFMNIPMQFRVDSEHVSAPELPLEEWDFKTLSDLGLTHDEVVNVLREFTELFVEGSHLIDQAGLFAVGKKFGIELVVNPNFETSDKDRIQQWLLERRCLLRIKTRDGRQVSVKSVSQFLVLD